ncbi:MAG: DUF533 domain-containing protein [Pirellulaceae bacterium]
MIIYGSRGIKSTIDTRPFHCPQCNDQREGNLRQVRNFFTLYFIPVIPLNVAGRFVECTTCRGNFNEDIYDYDPEKARKETEEQMLRVMILAALADGMVDDNEREEIKRQFQDLAGLPLTNDTLRQEIDMAMKANTNLNDYVSGIAPNLSNHGKVLVVKLAFFTMSAHGELKTGHNDQLSKLAKTLSIPQDQYMELIRQLSEADDL